MPDEPESKDDDAEDGLSLDEFKAAVAALAKLRDEGRAQLYFNRRPSLRLIADPEVVRAALAPGLQGDEAVNRANLLRSEVQYVANNVLRFDSVDSAVQLMERSRFDSDSPFTASEPVPADVREKFRAKAKAKAELALSSLVTVSVRDRMARLKSSTGPCLEDVDYELVKERRDSLRNRSLTSPFLRIRVRYTDIRQEQYLGGIFSFGGPETTSAPSSFELECDASDIDLLIKRLSDAKQRLLESETPEPESE